MSRAYDAQWAGTDPFYYHFIYKALEPAGLAGILFQHGIKRGVTSVDFLHRLLGQRFPYLEEGEDKAVEEQGT